MNFKTPLCSHIDRFMVIVSKMRDGKYISLSYKISVFYFERVFHSFLMSQAPERYIIEYPHKQLFLILLLADLIYSLLHLRIPR